MADVWPTGDLLTRWNQRQYLLKKYII